MLHPPSSSSINLYQRSICKPVYTDVLMPVKRQAYYHRERTSNQQKTPENESSLPRDAPSQKLSERIWLSA
jgi:hypothetical protein